METASKVHPGLSEEFFNKPLGSYKEGGQVVGEFFEELTRELFIGYAERLRLDSTADVCPDLQEIKRREFFIECKSAMAHIYTSQSKAKRVEWKITLDRVDNYANFFNNYFPDGSLENPDFSPALLYAFWGYDIREAKIGDFSKSGKLVKALTDSDKRLYLIDSNILSKMCELKTVSDAPSRGQTYRMRHCDFKPLDSDDLPGFREKWNMQDNDCVYSSFNKVGLEINKKIVDSFSVRLLVSQETYKKESISNFMSSNIKGQL